MSARPWYKRYGADFVFGTMGLSLEERGAYSICLDLIYDRQGPIPDDARYLAGVCGVSVRKWNSLRDRLVIAGKLHPVDGTLSNSRAVIELENAAKTARKLAENGAKGGNKSAETRQKPNDNNETVQAPLKPTRGLPEPEPEKKEGDLTVSVARGDRQPVREAFDLWNETAQRCGLPIAKGFNAARQRHIRARLVEGGLEGWRSALTAVSESPLCLGENERGWRADLDFVCQPKSFNRLVEGFYSAKAPSSATGPPVDPARFAAMNAEHTARQLAYLESLDAT